MNRPHVQRSVFPDVRELPGSAEPQANWNGKTGKNGEIKTGVLPDLSELPVLFRAPCLTGWLAALVFSSASLFGQAQPSLPSPSALKKMSMDHPMAIKVTSVSNQPQKLS